MELWQVRYMEEGEDAPEMMPMSRLMKMPALDTGVLSYDPRETGSPKSKERYEQSGGCPFKEEENCHPGDFLHLAQFGPSLLQRKRNEVASGYGDTADYEALRDEMRKGPGKADVPPIHIDSANNLVRDYSPLGLSRPSIFGNKKSIGNGGHRLAIAHELGWTHMPVTDSQVDSGYGDPTYERKWDDYEGDDSSAHLAAATESDHPQTPKPPANAPFKEQLNWVNKHGGPEARHAHSWSNAIDTHGLYTQLHGSPSISTTQFRNQQWAKNRAGEMAGQDKLDYPAGDVDASMRARQARRRARDMEA